MKSQSMPMRIGDVVIYMLLAILSLACFAPIVNTFALSLSDKVSASSGIVSFWPVHYTSLSYRVLFEDNTFLRAFGVSVLRVAIGGALNFILTLLMAYPLSKEPKAFRMRKAYMWIVIFTMLFHGGLIPWYLTIATVGIIDTIWALVLPTAVPVFNVVLLMNFFRGIPKEMEEAAVMDGSSPWHALFRIFVPLSLPALATVTLFSIVGHWNAFFDGLILMNHPANYPLQTYIQSLFIPLDNANLQDPNELKRYMEVSNLTLNSAKVIVSMVPILLIYPFLQKYFVSGIVLGSVKE